MLPSLPRTYSTQAAARRPLVAFMLEALRGRGCRILHEPDPSRALFVIAFEAPDGERIGVVAYAFTIGPRTVTRNRPEDERSFQIKYGSKAGNSPHELFRDPLDLMVTLFLGISPEEGFFVAADPAMHNPTRLFIRLEFKDEHVEAIQDAGWHAWERQRRGRISEDEDARIEVLVGGRQDRLLDLIRLERLAEGLPQGERQLLAESPALLGMALPAGPAGPMVPGLEDHPLIAELELEPGQVLDMIAGARRLKMAVRGWVAEEHLRERLAAVPGVSECEAPDVEGAPDLRLRWRGGAPLTVECKNVLRKTNAAGLPRLDFQRTRAAKGDPCSRYYAPTDFDVLAGCLHAVRERWEFSYIIPPSLAGHAKCPGKLASNVLVDERWTEDPGAVLDEAMRARGA